MMETGSHEIRSDLPTLRALDDWELQDSNQDIRGRALMTATGERLGTINDLLVDCEQERVAAVRLENGRIVPVEPLLIREETVVLLEERPDEEPARPAPKDQRSDRTAAPAPEVQPVAEPQLQREPIRVRRKPVQQAPVVPPHPKTSSSRKLWNWNKIGVGAAVLGAAAGAALLRRKGSEDDFELRLETDENLRLIASSKVEGTAVYARDGERLGEIDSFMVDKYTGRVAYAVMKMHGTFGFGSSLFPLPWPVLDYDVDRDGYLLDVGKEEFADAPKFQPSEEPEFDGDYRRRVLDYYGGTA
jgi:sporulation protein YlmC with PRC-barrel domain